MSEASTNIDIFLRLQDFATKELDALAKTTKKTARKAKTDLDRVGKSVKDLRVKFSSLATAAAGFVINAATIAALTRFGLNLVELASDADEAESKFAELFKETLPQASAEIDLLANKLGRARGTLLGAAADLQVLIQPLGFTAEQSKDFSLALTELGQDLESFNNEPFRDVIQAIKAGIIGSSEPLQKFGIDLRGARVDAEAAALGFERVNGELTKQQTFLAQLSIINKATERAQGDVIRTSDQWANSTRRLREQIKESRVELGRGLIPILQDAIRDLGGADEVAARVRRTTRLLAFAFGGLVRASVVVVRGLDRVTKALSANDDNVARSAENFSVLGFGIESVALTIVLLAESTAASVRLIADIIDVQINKSIKAMNTLIKAANKVQRFFFAPEIPLIPIDEDANTSAIKSLEDFGKRSAKFSREFVIGLGKAAASAAKFQIQLGGLTGRKKPGGVDTKGLESLILGEGALGGSIDAALNEEKTVGQAAAVAQGVKVVADNFGILGVAATKAAEGVAFATASVASTVVEIAKTPQAVLGAQAAFEEWKESLSDFNLGRDLASGVFNSIENSLSGLSRSLVEGKADFAAFTESLLKNIGQLIVQFILLSTISNALKGFSLFGGTPGVGPDGPLPLANGGVMQGRMGPNIPVNAYANGGIARSPQLALFGEGRGAEAFVPLPDGRTIPVTMNGGGGGANVTINLNAIDAKSGVEFLQQNARTIGDTISSQIEGGANRKLNKAVGRA